MALLVCKTCKKAFISSPQGEEVCPDCDDRLRELYPLIRNFLRNNDGVYTAQDVSRIMGIAMEDVRALVSMGFLEPKTYRKAADNSKVNTHTHVRRKKAKSAGR